MVRGAESLRSVMSAITAMKLAPSSAGGGGDNSANSGNSWEFFPIDFLLSDWNHKQAQVYHKIQFSCLEEFQTKLSGLIYVYGHFGFMVSIPRYSLFVTAK